MALSPPGATMGFVGYARLRSPLGNVQMRATDADLSLTQDIDRPDVIDGRFDRTVYQLQPMVVEGSLDFPAIMENVNQGADPTAMMYRLAAKRNFPGDGKLTSSDILISYTNQAATFLYRDCIIDEFSWNVSQGESVNISTSIIGVDRQQNSHEPITQNSQYFPGQSRIVTWNDAVVNIENPGLFSIGGENIREFDATLTNNSERYYTLNGKMFPQDVAPRQRDISGNLTFMGRMQNLGQHARTNLDRCSEDSTVTFGYRLTNANCSGTFLVTLPNCIFKIEELSLTTDIFTTSVEWYSLPNQIDLTASNILTTT